MADKDDKDAKGTTISFVNGNDLKIKASADQVAGVIEQAKAQAELIHVTDSEDNTVWINAAHIVSLTSE